MEFTAFFIKLTFIAESAKITISRRFADAETDRLKTLYKPLAGRYYIHRKTKRDGFKE
jgi:hypothetical protein